MYAGGLALWYRRNCVAGLLVQSTARLSYGTHGAEHIFN